MSNQAHRRLLALCLSFCCLAVQANAELSVREIVGAVDDRIEQHRKRDAVLALTLPDGNALPAEAVVEIELVRHAFLFGANLFAFGEHEGSVEATYRSRFADVMNYASLPFYWNTYQSSPGSSDSVRVRRMAEWCQARGIVTKGHPLVWNMEPGWLAKLPKRQRDQLFWSRVPDLVSSYAGLIDTWDVVNESTEGIKYAKQRSATALLDAYETYGTTGVVQMAFDQANKANASATLILNDYDTTEAFERQIQTALRNGAKIDAIGIQAHMHQGYWGAKKLWDVCERFSKFGLPIQFSEVTILSGTPMRSFKPDWNTHRTNWRSTPRGEKRQAADVREFYHVLFSHPAVEAITWWDMSDRDAWLGAPGGLLRKDLEPKQAYYVVRDLVKKGWHTKIATTAIGEDIRMRGFYGDYRVTVTHREATYTGRFRLERSDQQTIKMELKRSRIRK